MLSESAERRRAKEESWKYRGPIERRFEGSIGDPVVISVESTELNVEVGNRIDEIACRLFDCDRRSAK